MPERVMQERAGRRHRRDRICGPVKQQLLQFNDLRIGRLTRDRTQIGDSRFHQNSRQKTGDWLTT